MNKVVLDDNRGEFDVRTMFDGRPVPGKSDLEILEDMARFMIDQDEEGKHQIVYLQLGNTSDMDYDKQTCERVRSVYCGSTFNGFNQNEPTLHYFLSQKKDDYFILCETFGSNHISTRAWRIPKTSYAYGAALGILV